MSVVASFRDRRVVIFLRNRRAVIFLRNRRAVGPLRQFSQRLRAKAFEKLRIDVAGQRHHLTDHLAGFGGRVRRIAHAPQPMQHDSGDGVHHGRECGQRQNVSRDFDGALFG